MIIWTGDCSFAAAERCDQICFVECPQILCGWCAPLPSVHYLKWPSQGRFSFNAVLILCALFSAVTRFCSDGLGCHSTEPVLLPRRVIVKSFLCSVVPNLIVRHQKYHPSITGNKCQCCCVSRSHKPVVRAVHTGIVLKYYHNLNKTRQL